MNKYTGVLILIPHDGNDTGDKSNSSIRNGTEKYRSNYDRIFDKEKKETNVLLKKEELN